MHQLYLSLGSNLGDREHMLQEALRLIGEDIGNVIRVSSFVETRPWGYESEHLFLNAACKVETTLSPMECLHVTQEIERRLGRTVKSHNGYCDRPIDIDTHQIGNVTTNYNYYLTGILLPGILEMIVILVLIYSLGAELKFGTSRHLMDTAGHSIVTALAGKLLVWTLVFSAIGFLIIMLLFHWLHFPISGSIFNMFIAVFLLVISSEAAGIFILELLPVPRLALSVGALYSVLGLSLSGFTLPLEAMPPYIQGLAVMFPLRHYYLFHVQEVIFGAGFAGWWQEVIHMLMFLFIPLAGLKRLKNVYIHQNFPKE